MREILPARVRAFPFQARAAGVCVHRHQHQVVLAGIIKPQRFGELRGGGEMQEAIGLVVGRTGIVSGRGHPFGPRHDLEDQHVLSCS